MFYTIDEMVPRTYDAWLTEESNGSLELLSEGRMQLARVLEDAKKLVEKHVKPFIVGLSKKK